VYNNFGDDDKTPVTANTFDLQILQVGRSKAETMDGRLFSNLRLRRNEEVEISPELAVLWLERRNKQNRPINLRKVLKVSQDIRNGNFPVTNQGIGFDYHGVLTDGQNRLAGVVKADVPVRMLVCTGLEPESRKYVDMPGFGNRNTADVMSMFADFETPQTASKALSGIRRYAFNNNKPIRPDEVIEEANRFKAGLHFVCRTAGSSKLSSSPILGACALAYMRHEYRGIVEKVYEDLKGASLPFGDPVQMYLEWLGRCGTMRGDTLKEAFVKLLKVIHARGRGERISNLRGSDTILQYFKDGV
jgi:hypothetical protein